MDNYYSHYDDSSWITTAETRYQQLLRKDVHIESALSEKDMRYQQRLNKDVHSESALSEKDLQSRQGFQLPSSSDKKEVKAGISCNLCFIVASDNALMEEHLMGPAHIRNVEKEAMKCREKIECQKNSGVANETVDAIASDVEVSNCEQARTYDDIVKSTIEDRNIVNDTHRDDKGTLSKNKNDKNEVIVVQDETTDEVNNCEICKYFQGDTGEFQKYQIPEHFCQKYYKNPELPSGWTEKTSRTSGCSYYVNNVTKEKQWHWPTEPASTQSPGTAEYKANKQTIDKDELPQGWVKKKAKSNGLTFYVNKLTNDWQWDRPTKSLPSEATGDFSAATSKDVEKNSDNSAGVTEAGMNSRGVSKAGMNSPGVTKAEMNSRGVSKAGMNSPGVSKAGMNSPSVTKAGMMVSKLQVMSGRFKEEALASNEVEKLPVKRTGEINSNLNERVIINHEDQMKLDLMHWKQATEQWNNL